MRYIYLNGGASNSIGDGWNWRVLNDGQRATRFVEESVKLGMIPYFVWYNIPDGGESYYTDKAHIESKTYMEGYFADLRHALEITKEAAVMNPSAGARAGFPRLLRAEQHRNARHHCRADRCGLHERRAGEGRRPDVPQYPARPVEAINYTISKYQPNAIFGWQFNLWASPAGGFTNAGITGKGIVRLTDTLGLAKGRNAIYNEAKAIANYYVSAGILTHGAKFISIDKYGLDAGFENKNSDPQQSTWFWNATH